jgi:hypothetical protein
MELRSARYLVLLAGILSRAGAQTPPSASATLTGRVHTEANVPVAGAHVAVVAGGPDVVTDSAGHFVLSHAPAGHTELVIRRIGFEPSLFTLDLTAHDTTDVELMLTEAAHPLAPVDVNATNGAAMALARFYDHRSSSGGGHFIERADIERAQPQRLSDMLRSIPGFSFQTDPLQQRDVRVARSRLGPAAACPVQYWVDGMRVQEFNLDEVAPRDVEAMEIYAGPAALPPEYRTMNGTAGCGTIAVWTRVPAKR